MKQMQHLSEEQLIAYCFGDAEDISAFKEHLAACGGCRRDLEELRQTLAAVEAVPVPERNEAYGREVWARLQPRLEEARERRARWRGWFQPQRWALAATVVAVLVVGILVGRFTSPPGSPGLSDEQVRERILLVAVGDHLERSQMVLIELVNAGGNGAVDISAEREWAEDLIADNRLYRLTAADTGDAALASLLEELGRVLLEIARSPSELSSEEFGQIRGRIEEQGILFKVRVLGSQVREREESGWEEPDPQGSQS